MKTKLQLISVAIVILLLTSTPAFVKAQSESPGSSSTIVVTGRIVNENQPGKVPEGLDTMLHAWDQSQTEKPMLHGKSLADGTFKFEGVPADAGLTYAAMVIYDDGTYVSTESNLENGKTSLDLEVPIYESTNDPAQVKIDQEHVLFSFADDGIEVKEFYLLSNVGDRTVKNTLLTGDGKNGALKFTLPEQAQYVNFEPQEENRFVTVAGGFVDTVPFIPGLKSRQIIVNFVVPYPEQNSFAYQAPYPIDNMNFLFPASAGVTLTGEGLTSGDTLTTSDGSQILSYTASNLKSGQTLKVAFSGRPKLTSSENNVKTGTTIPAKGVSLPVTIAAGVLGLGLVAGGVWWWRRPRKEEDEVLIEPSDFQRLLTEIALLDRAAERKEVEPETYQQQRAEMVEHAKMLIISKDPLLEGKEDK